MSFWLDRLVVGALVAFSVGYAALALGPRGWRRRLYVSAAAFAARLSWLPGAATLGARLARASQAGGCGGCGSCADSRPPAAGETRVAVSRIGRR